MSNLNTRFITATALFDGHDASINIMRRLLQAGGAEVVHLGHNRSVREIVETAIQEDAHAIAVSSYQGGHMEFFKYMREMLDQSGRQEVRIFGGGGGVIVDDEIKELHAHGITKIYSPDDGLALGLQGIISDMLEKSRYNKWQWQEKNQAETIKFGSLDFKKQFARAITLIEAGKFKEIPIPFLLSYPKTKEVVAPVLGVTGTGGAGKSSLTDELIRRFLLEFPDIQIAVFSVDPSKKKTGGALLGDRIRMNAIDHPNVFMRSFATKGQKSELGESLSEVIRFTKQLPFDLIIVETSGIGQGDTDILTVSDVSLYVMTSEFGAATQLEKIDMLDFADAIAINKFDRRGSEDAFRDVKHQLRRTRFAGQWKEDHEYPLFGTIASQFSDNGVTALFHSLCDIINHKTKTFPFKPSLRLAGSQKSTFGNPIIPPKRTQYLSEISDCVRQYHEKTQFLQRTSQILESFDILNSCQVELPAKQRDAYQSEFDSLCDASLKEQINNWDKISANYSGDQFEYQVRGKSFHVPTKVTSLSGLKIPRVSLPKYKSKTELISFLRKENLPGQFPYTSGVFPFRRTDEDPKRQFAGEGGPERTNRRFHFLTKDDPAKRLSTAFDSVTLYGEDPHLRPDIFGKVGESGVSIATLQDMKDLYKGFDLCDPNTSVSMTINGPAPILLAFYFNCAMDQQLDKFRSKNGREPTEAERESVYKYTLTQIRGTVQADILKEDQAQNTCIFNTDFALKMMGDIQSFFIENEVKNYYSVSISGYHIAEAGANPISQLAFTLANGFTYVEYYLSRGMKIDDFAPSLSFFFSNGMDPEYSVIGRVARRIWAIAMRDVYGANERSQKLKYHIQTSGRSLHAQEIDFNDIRTTLQALIALSDNCNSLHTNAYDEAITTPTEESVRRSMAIQLILNREFGPNKNENTIQGSYFFDELTDMVESAVLEEFDKISSRGGVLGAMETQYQRGKIQEESLFYETKKHDGSLPIVGVNTFLNPLKGQDLQKPKMELARASQDEKRDQLRRLEKFREAFAIQKEQALLKLSNVVLGGQNIFAELLHTTRFATLGEITEHLYKLGGKYRRSL